MLIIFGSDKILSEIPPRFLFGDIFNLLGLAGYFTFLFFYLSLKKHSSISYLLTLFYYRFI